MLTQEKRELGQKKELREEVHSMQRILRISLLTCCVPGDTNRHSARLGTVLEAGTEPFVNKLCSPAALRGKCSPATSAGFMLSEVLGGCTALWHVRNAHCLSTSRLWTGNLSFLSPNSLWLMCCTLYPAPLPKPSSLFCYPAQ